MHGSVLENIVANILHATGRRFLMGHPSSPTDFVVEGQGSSRTFIEVQSFVNKKTLDVFFGRLLRTELHRNHDDVLLVTENEPTPSAAEEFRLRATRAKVNARWLSVASLAKELGYTTDNVSLSPEWIDSLQTKAITDRIAEYHDLDAGQWQMAGVTGHGEGQTRGLERQLSAKAIAALERDSVALHQRLRIGQQTAAPVIVLLSDLADFSSLVQHAEQTFLCEAMPRYYRKCRELVWAHDGVLDKFIGDAVLAFWGYPYPTDGDVENALRFSGELIALGQDLIAEFEAQHNERSTWGTRIGIASGKVVVLELAGKDMELSFIGRPINLAARLEKNASVNGVLIDHKARERLFTHAEPLAKALSMAPITLSEDLAKGMGATIQAHRVDIQNMPPRNSVSKP